MTRQALVLRIDGSLAYLRRPHDLCETCGSRFCSPRNRDIRAVIPETLDVAIDDWVELSYSGLHTAIDAVLILGLPALGFVAAYLAAPMVTGSLSGEIARAASGLCGLGIGAVVPMVRRFLSPDYGLPTINRVLRKRPDRTRTLDRTPRLPDV